MWGAILISKAVMWVYSLPVFPLAYLFRTPVWENYHHGSTTEKIMAFPLWIVLNDENMYGESWWRQDLPNNFYKAWLWAWVRNNSWNWNQFVRVKTGTEHEVRVWTSDNRPALLHRRFKWEYKHVLGFVDRWPIIEWRGDWNTNQGDRLSQDRTWLGTAWAVYKVWYLGDDIPKFAGPYWRFSHAGIHWGWMLNIKAGYNKRGEALLDIKIKRFKPFYTKHWT